MTLTIGKLSTRCRAPKGFERQGALVDSIAHGPLANELKAQLGPSLDRLPAVIRLKDLRVRVKVPARNLNATSLASAWARAFTAALHRALAYPPGDGVVSSRRHKTDAAYRAAMLHHLAVHGTAPCWEFPEIEAWRGTSPAETALRVLLDNPARIAEILAELERQAWLERLLSLWDELSLERVMQAVAGDENQSPALSLDHFIELAHAATATGALRPEWAFAGRRQAIRLWMRLNPRFPLRGVWHGLRLLQRFLEVPALLILRDPALLADPIPFPAWCEAIVTRAPWSGAASPANSLSGVVPSPIPALAVVLDALRPLVRSAATSVSTAPAVARWAPSTVQWIVSDCAGILLMLSIVERLNLWRFVRTPEFLRFGGPRSLSFVLAGMGMTLIRPWTLQDPVEPAVALFAGVFGEIYPGGMGQFFAQTKAGIVREFVQAETWDQALDRGATELARSFTAQVRGFRQASREAVAKQFVRMRGRILVEQTRLLAVLAPTPWAVALHISGMDDSVAPGERMGYRRVEFVLEGL
jgi:hypothetical protein